MRRQSFIYRNGGWSDPLPALLDSPETLVLVFGASKYLQDSRPIRELQSSFSRSHLIGCSSAGEIHGSSIEDGSLSATIVCFQQSRVASVFSHKSGENSVSAGREIAKALSEPDLKGLIVFGNGVGINGSDLVRGLNEELSPSVAVTGGLAGDGERFERTWVLSQDVHSDHGVAAIVLYGESLRVGHGTHGGWSIFGPERQVTRSEGTTLYELDGRPPLDLYKEYLGNRAGELPAVALRLPLALLSDRTDAPHSVRTVVSIDESSGAMVFAGDIPEGGRVRLMRTTFESLIGGAGNAARTAGPPLGRPESSLAVVVSCVGRRLMLGERTEEELESLMGDLQPGTYQTGFYSYGEIVPRAFGPCDLQNQTITLTLISET